MIKWKALEKSVDESSKMTQKPRIRFLNQLDFCDFSFDLKDKIYNFDDPNDDADVYATVN